jgi:hypothetical protein
MGYYEGMWGLEGLVNDKLFWKGQRAELLAENDRLEELNEKMLKWWKEMSVLRFTVAQKTVRMFGYFSLKSIASHTS